MINSLCIYLMNFLSFQCKIKVVFTRIKSKGGFSQLSNPTDIKRYDVLFAGRLRTGFTQSMIIENINNNAILNNGRVDEIDFEQSRAVLYSSPSKGKTIQICQALSDAGLSCKVRRVSLSADKNNPPQEPRAMRYVILTMITIIAILLMRSFVV